MIPPPDVPTRLTVTVAVVVKDRRDLMVRCLAAIEALDPAPDAVVLVDNGSTDGTFELLKEHAATATVPVSVRRVEGSLGRARNAAVVAATTDVIAFTDSDCEPRPDWLTHGLAALGPDVALVQGRTVPREPVTAPWPATQELDGFTHLYEACNLFCRRDVLEAAGGFGEDIGFFGEDTVAGWRVRRLGWNSAFAADAVVAHEVTYPGLAWHLRRAGHYAHFAVLVREFPEMRRELFWYGAFLRRRNAEFLAALVGGVGLALGRPRLAVLAVPYLWRRRPRPATWEQLMRSVEATAFDAAVEAALVRGSVKERTLVL